MDEQQERQKFEQWALDNDLAYVDKYGYFWFHEYGSGHDMWRAWRARANADGVEGKDHG